MGKLRRKDLVEPELSYAIVGALFDVYNNLGSGHRESAYERAIAEALKERHLSFQEQVIFPLTYNGKVIGNGRLDFLVDDRVVLEVKRENRILRKDAIQILSYLKLSNKKLGILANFTRDGVQFKRIVNIHS